MDRPPTGDPIPDKNAEVFEQAKRDVEMYTRGREFLKDAANHVEALFEDEDDDVESQDIKYGGAAAYIEALLPLNDPDKILSALPDTVRAFIQLSSPPTIEDFESYIRIQGGVAAIDRLCDVKHISSKASELAQSVLAAIEHGRLDIGMNTLHNETDQSIRHAALMLIIPASIIQPSGDPNTTISLLSELKDSRERFSSLLPTSEIHHLRVEAIGATYCLNEVKNRFYNYSTSCKIALIEEYTTSMQLTKNPANFLTITMLMPTGEFHQLKPLLSTRVLSLFKTDSEKLSDALHTAGKGSEEEGHPTVLSYSVDTTHQGESVRMLLDALEPMLDSIAPELYRNFGNRILEYIPNPISLVDMKRPLTVQEVLEELKNMGLKPGGLIEIALLHEKFPQLLGSGLQIAGLADRTTYEDIDKSEIIRMPCLSIDTDDDKRYLDLYHQSSDSLFEDTTWRIIAVPA